MGTKVRAMRAMSAVVLMRGVLMVLVLMVLVLELGKIHLHRKALLRVAVQHAVLPLLRMRLVIHAEGVVRGRLWSRRTCWRGSIRIESYSAATCDR